MYATYDCTPLSAYLNPYVSQNHELCVKIRNSYVQSST